MRLYRVKYNFTAEEDGELSVRKGDLVKVSGDEAADEVGKDGWTLVETLSPPFAKGYVPSNYISKADTPTTSSTRSIDGLTAGASSPASSPVGSHFGRPGTAGSAGSGSGLSGRVGLRAASSGGSDVVQVPAPAQSVGSQEKSPTKASRLAPIRRLSDPRLPQHLLETLENSDSLPAPPQAPYSSPSTVPARAHAPPMSQQQQQQQQQPQQQHLSERQADLLAYDQQPQGGATQFIDLNRLFASHDNWLAHVLGEREREAGALEASVGVCTKALERVREKNRDVAARVGSIEAQLESQRHLLKLRMAEDSQNANSRFQQLYA
jgi:hypothetical protein